MIRAGVRLMADRCATDGRHGLPPRQSSSSAARPQHVTACLFNYRANGGDDKADPISIFCDEPDDPLGLHSYVDYAVLARRDCRNRDNSVDAVGLILELESE